MRISDWSSDVCSSDLKPDLADTERRGDLLDEAAKGGGIERPYLDGDAGPGKARHAHQPRLGRPGVRQHEQPVVGRGARFAHQSGAEREPPAIERHARQKIGRAAWRESVCTYV